MADDPGPTLDDATLTDHERFNRADWNAYSDEYQAKHGADLAAQDGYAWGTWQVPETELQVLGRCRAARTSSSSDAVRRSGPSASRGAVRARSGWTCPTASSSTPDG